MAGRIGELIQPVRLELACQQLVGTAANSVGALTTWEPMLVQVDAEQIQIFGAQLATEEKVVRQTAVDIFDDGTARIV